MPSLTQSAGNTPHPCSIKTDSGALAVLTLDASGGAARQRVQIVGDQSRCALAGKSSAPELQEVRVEAG